MTRRLRRRIEHDFEPGSVEAAIERLESLDLGTDGRDALGVGPPDE